MELKSIRIRNFRTVEKEQRLDLDGGLTIVGPNNSGKTNLLKAIELLFTGYNNTFGYSREKDLTFWVGRAQTSLVANFDGDPDESPEIYDCLDELHDILGTSRGDDTEFSLNLYFTNSSNPVYRIFPNAKKPDDNSARAQYSRKQKELTQRLLSTFVLHYVPSAKGMESLYQDLIIPVMKEAAAQRMHANIQVLENELDRIAENINQQFSIAGLDGIKASFQLPGDSLKDLISGFDLLLQDPSETSVFRKGMGIQSVALIASFMWITKEEMKDEKNVIWLLEEPESYLHPELSESVRKMLSNLREQSLVVTTTHSVGFIPQDPENVIGTSLVGTGSSRRTDIHTYNTYFEATKRLRNSLGVKFSDFYNLGRFNVFVEGQSDRELFQWFLDLLQEFDEPTPEWDYVFKSKFLDFGGVKQLEGFVRATWKLIRHERPTVVILDGDEAGERTRRALQGYFGNKEIGFTPNYDFISVRNRFPIEGLFPDDWIKDAHNDNPNWFSNFSIDASGSLEPFNVKDSKKGSLQTLLTSKARRESNLDWAERWISVCSTLDEALSRKHENLMLEGVES
jgi:predicted ATP-dependent endonuclease of OLD family